MTENNVLVDIFKTLMDPQGIRGAIETMMNLSMQFERTQYLKELSIWKLNAMKEKKKERDMQMDLKTRPSKRLLAFKGGQFTHYPYQLSMSDLFRELTSEASLERS